MKTKCSIKKLTDNEIVKALECCTTNGATCKECPAFVKVDRSNCKKYFRGALDLINRLQAEIEKWQGGYMTQKQEIANLEIELKAMRGAANSYKAENERLTKENAILSQNADTAFQDGLNEAQDLYAEQVKTEIKAEAYKEFAESAVERVDNAKQKYQRLCKEQGEEMEEHMHIHFNGITKIINNLLKELVGEDG